ncbi:DNA helicase-2/ATP-dependent DNA helicase PcrA [Mobilisporobacter senegalensis]|uniref:DNA 3'-5' helicase n=1 Tax=Mobilisporobacter senegalensis TaxID=1329262 RepID=A0A3N1XXS7_9FIRM|nr:ATP-dependent helicase [Mobilisporobacter senegalensis]ROR31394.1 DNA helicase-2/ATP-dependent DNA helicase PcrA [Mobilisporobacter senegalensis]
MNFNVSQEKAITHGKGPMMVLAGPGSGKTLVITRRTKYLIEEYGVDPRNILVITFTKAAANEMRERFQKLMGENHIPVNFGTFHAIFFTILKYAYHFNSGNILKEDQKKQFMREIIEKLDLEIEDEKDFINGIENEISLVKGERINLDHYYSINCSEDIFKKIYEEYDNRLRRANLIDFDDMLVYCYELLKERKDILKIWQDKFRYILIDEFQDINKIQYDIIRLLAKPEDNLFIVGDDDQSIYRFRGAKPEIMLNFEKDYMNAKSVLLDVNYRSTVKIIEGAKRVVKNNMKRFSKNIITINSEGEDIQLKTFKELALENQTIIDEVLSYQKKGIPLSEIAILFRTNTQPRALLEKFMEYNIPFKMKDSMPNIYEHWIAKNLIGYIKLAMGQKDRSLFLQIMNRPKRYISREYLTETTVDFEQLKRKYSDKDWMIERIEKLEYDLKMLSNMNPFSGINYIRKGIGYEEYLKEYADYRRIKIDELLEVLDEIQESAKNYKTYEEWFTHIEEYALELAEQAKNQRENDIDSITMTTMHSSKGLEYEVVFIIDANEGITPHHKAMLEVDMEEERRMFYVAMTRARKYLHIYSVKERYNKELEISRFVGELLLDISELKTGAWIEHKMYGPGEIKQNKDGKLIIYFKNIKKERTLDLNFCVNHHMLKLINKK